MRWNLVELVEPDPPPGAEPVHWYLWTLEPAATAAEVLEVVRKYTCRWPIEEMHLVLKSGCQAEALRLETWDRLEKAVTLQSAVAARIVALRDRARQAPEAPALELLMRRRPRRWPVTSRRMASSATIARRSCGSVGSVATSIGRETGCRVFGPCGVAS